MGYSDDPTMVRVDFFKPSGKWGYTEAVRWTGGWDKTHDLHEAFRTSLRDHLGPPNPKFNNVRMAGLRAVCLEPYHEAGYPICYDVPESGPIP
jgi:hypothetical protein